MLSLTWSTALIFFFFFDSDCLSTKEDFTKYLCNFMHLHFRQLLKHSSIGVRAVVIGHSGHEHPYRYVFFLVISRGLFDARLRTRFN